MSGTEPGEGEAFCDFLERTDREIELRSFRESADAGEEEGEMTPFQKVVPYSKTADAGKEPSS
jgi:hypothetical protein